MIIGVISDTHDNLVGLKQAIEIFKTKNIEMLIHCGDWVSPFTLEFLDRQIEGLNIPVMTVVGNNFGDLKRIMIGNSKMINPLGWPRRVTHTPNLANKKAIIYHGEDREILAALIDCQKYDVIFTGHTHAIRNEIIGKTLVLNPGSTSYTCEGQILDKASIAIYNPTTNSAEIIYF